MIAQINNSLFYKDRFTAYRLIKGKNEDGSTGQRLELTGLEDLPCRASRKTSDSANMGEGSVNPVTVTLLLFTHPEYPLKAGYTLAINHAGHTRRYLAGEPYVYDNHQELELYIEGEA